MWHFGASRLPQTSWQFRTAGWTSVERTENEREGDERGRLGVTFPRSVTCYVCTTDFERGIFVGPLSRTKTATACATRAPCTVLVGLQLLSTTSVVCRVGWVNRRCSISLRSFHARMETGCSGLHVLLRAPANSCKGVVDDYNAVDIVVHCNLMRSAAELCPLWNRLILKLL